MTEEKVWDLLAKLVASQQKTDEQIAKTDRSSSALAKCSGGVSNNGHEIGARTHGAEEALKHQGELIQQLIQQMDALSRWIQCWSTNDKL